MQEGVMENNKDGKKITKLSFLTSYFCEIKMNLTTSSFY